MLLVVDNTGFRIHNRDALIAKSIRMELDRRIISKINKILRLRFRRPRLFLHCHLNVATSVVLSFLQRLFVGAYLVNPRREISHGAGQFVPDLVLKR